MLPQRIKHKSDKAEKGRFLTYVEERNGCWLWDGQLNDKGYGVFCCYGKHHAAHRISYALFNGPVGDLHVLHRCDVRNCVNPDHLWLGTHADNMRDMAAKGRRRGPVGEAVQFAVLTEAQVREILASDERGVDLAARYGVTKGAIYNIRNGKTWKAVSNAAV